LILKKLVYRNLKYAKKWKISMKIAIIYDSKFGSNIKVSEHMRKLLEEGNEIAVNYAKDITPKKVAESNIDVLLFGGPLRAGNLSYTIRKWAEKFGKVAKQKGITLKYVGAWETKGFIEAGIKEKAEGIEKRIMEKMELTPEKLKELMANIPVQNQPKPPMSLFIITPDGKDMKDAYLEENYQSKIEDFILNLLN
jgi:menaquinone-dependent protoporphyrinogen IX oxidase